MSQKTQSAATLGENFKSCTVGKCDTFSQWFQNTNILTITSKYDKRDIFDELNL